MLLAGALAATTLVQQQFPNVSQPTVSIGVTYSGASTTVMRDSIVKPIEDTIAGTQDLQTLSSNIQAGQATISATFAITSNQNTDLVNIQKAVQSAEHNLPTDLQPPTLATSAMRSTCVADVHGSTAPAEAGAAFAAAPGALIGRPRTDCGEVMSPRMSIWVSRFGS